MGYDVDFRGGYDFGMFRLEGELAYKHANRQELRNFVPRPTNCNIDTERNADEYGR